MRYYNIFFVLLVSCSLDINNLNDPDLDKLQAQDNYVLEAGQLINDWFLINHNYSSPALALLSASDAATCSWGTSGMRDFGLEPRSVFNNKESYPYAFVNENYYKSLYNVLSKTRDLLVYILKRNSGEDYKKEQAVCYFVQGLCHGYLGLVYDRSYILTENTDLSKEQNIQSYQNMIDQSIKSLDKCIRICNEDDFEIPSKWIAHENYNQDSLKCIANSMAARFLTYSPRNKYENNNVEWQKVYNYAIQGIKTDFSPLADDLDWYSQYHTYAVYPGWAQVDMYVLNLMDPRMPQTFPDSADFNDLPDNGLAISEDARLESDFEYLGYCPYRPERGYYYFSPYRYKRLDNYIHNWDTKMPEFRKAENDYIIAEACIYLNKFSEAQDILNHSARIIRGGLPFISQEKDDLIKAIHYERMVELFVSGPGLQFFEMRKTELLQKGTIHHMPIPNSELKLLDISYYTFGDGVGNPNIDYSTNGWK